MPTAFYVVDACDWNEAAGPTGYERAHVWYGPLPTREEARELADGSMEDDAIVVEMDRGDDAPEPWPAPDTSGLAAETLARRVEQLADLWAGVSPDVREAVDAECGGLVAALDALVDAASEIEEAAA